MITGLLRAPDNIDSRLNCVMFANCRTVISPTPLVPQTKTATRPACSVDLMQTLEESTISKMTMLVVQILDEMEVVRVLLDNLVQTVTMVDSCTNSG